MTTPIEPAEIELELTYLATKLPTQVQGVTPKRLIDIYIPESGVDHARLRLRQKGDTYQMTKKVPLREGDASAHTEMTIPLDEAEFAALGSVSNKRIEKDRYDVVIDGYRAEVDVFLGTLNGLVLIDFEFLSEDDKAAFKQPSVCLSDVTQENFVAGGLLAGKSYKDIKPELDKFSYKAL